MTLLINETAKTETATYFDATCNKVTALVAIYSHGVQVCCKNASHRTWKGFGKLYPNAEAASASYKSAEMKAIIAAAVEFSK